VIPGSPATANLRRLLTELGESARTGALHIDGRPGGVLYLVAGRIAYAETPACPGIGDRLVGSGRIADQTWRRVLAEGRGAHRVGRLLLRDGLIGQNELALRLVAAIADATHELLQSAEAPVRFVPGERHWLGPVTGVALGAVGHVTARRLRGDGSHNSRSDGRVTRPSTMTHMGCD
jgi:hypothetical protein